MREPVYNKMGRLIGHQEISWTPKAKAPRTFTISEAQLRTLVQQAVERAIDERLGQSPRLAANADEWDVRDDPQW